MSWIRAALCLGLVLSGFTRAGGAGPPPDDLRNERVVTYSTALLAPAEAYRVRTGKLLIYVPCTDPRLNVRRPTGLKTAPCYLTQDGTGTTVNLTSTPNVKVSIRLLRGQQLPERPAGQ